MKSLKWMESASCQDVDPELFFTEKKPSVPCLRTAEAKAICSSCPVSVECLDFAVSTPWVQYGVWAGLEAAQIRQLAGARAGG